VQTWLQHSPSLPQVSLLAWQKYALLHWPLAQRLEQHSVPAMQLEPRTLQTPPLTEAHVPLVQLPVQHSLAAVHKAPTFLQAIAPHLPLTQLALQQSVLTLQAALSGWQKMVAPHFPLVQTPSQQSVPTAHV
jgi:hypothetical protein